MQKLNKSIRHGQKKNQLLQLYKISISEQNGQLSIIPKISRITI